MCAENMAPILESNRFFSMRADKYAAVSWNYVCFRQKRKSRFPFLTNDSFVMEYLETLRIRKNI